MVLFELFATFFKIGILSFSGGYAMIPFLQTEALGKGWLSLPEFVDMVAISQMTPGPIAVNMATYVGYTQGGVLGSLAATIGVCTPSFVIMLLLVRFFNKFRDKPLMQHVFYGIRPAVVGLILAAALSIARLEFLPVAGINVKAVFLFALCLGAMVRFKANPMLCIVLSGVAGVVFF